MLVYSVYPTRRTLGQIFVSLGPKRPELIIIDPIWSTAAFEGAHTSIFELRLTECLLKSFNLEN